MIRVKQTTKLPGVMVIIMIWEDQWSLAILGHWWWWWSEGRRQQLMEGGPVVATASHTIPIAQAQTQAQAVHHKHKQCITQFHCRCCAKVSRIHQICLRVLQPLDLSKSYRKSQLWRQPVLQRFSWTSHGHLKGSVKSTEAFRGRKSLQWMYSV